MGVNDRGSERSKPKSLRTRWRIALSCPYKRENATMSSTNSIFISTVSLAQRLNAQIARYIL